MNPRSVGLFLSLLALDSSAVLPGSVYVREPSVILVRRDVLPDVCRTSARVEACTAFVGQVLTCRCEAAESAWHIRARAQFVPVMYLMNGAHVAHERDHVRDVEESVRDYVDGLALRVFDSEAMCQEVAADEAARFPLRMDHFKDDSNAKRHSGYRRAFAPDHSLKPVIR